MFETQGRTRNRTRDFPKKGSAFILSSDHWTDMHVNKSTCKNNTHAASPPWPTKRISPRRGRALTPNSNAISSCIYASLHNRIHKDVATDGKLGLIDHTEACAGGSHGHNQAVAHGKCDSPYIALDVSSAHQHDVCSEAPGPWPHVRGATDPAAKETGGPKGHDGAC